MKIAKVLVGIVVVCGILFGILVIVRIPHGITNKNRGAGGENSRDETHFG